MVALSISLSFAVSKFVFIIFLKYCNRICTYMMIDLRNETAHLLYCFNSIFLFSFFYDLSLCWRFVRVFLILLVRICIL